MVIQASIVCNNNHLLKRMATEISLQFIIYVYLTLLWSYLIKLQGEE